MLKRILALILAAITTAVMLCGCSLVEKPQSDKLQIVTTIFPAYDFARAIFGDRADITLLLKPGTESHSYDPSARDIVKIDGSDLFIYNGGESDAWVENILKTADEVNAVRMMSFVEPLNEEELIGVEAHDREEDDEYDEHVWTSPKNAALIVRGIAGEAARLDSANADYYKQNAAEYSERILDLDRRFSELLAGESRCFVFGDRFPLLYFFKEYDLKYYAAFPGCGAETEPSAATIAFLTEKLADGGTVPAVFCIELSNRKLAETLAGENALPVAEFHTCHNITASDFEAGESYASLMERNFQTLQNLLNASAAQ